MVLRRFFPAVFACILGCTQAPTPEFSSGIFVYPEEDFEIPPSVLQLKAGMSQTEVVSILSPHFKRIHNQRIAHLPPISDAFEYEENGETKYIGIWYVSQRLDIVRVGFDYLRGI